MFIPFTVNRFINKKITIIKKQFGCGWVNIIFFIKNGKKMYTVNTKLGEILNFVYVLAVAINMWLRWTFF